MEDLVLDFLAKADYIPDAVREEAARYIVERKQEAEGESEKESQ